MHRRRQVARPLALHDINRPHGINSTLAIRFVQIRVPRRATSRCGGGAIRMTHRTGRRLSLESSSSHPPSSASFKATESRDLNVPSSRSNLRECFAIEFIARACRHSDAGNVFSEIDLTRRLAQFRRSGHPSAGHALGDPRYETCRATQIIAGRESLRSMIE